MTDDSSHRVYQYHSSSIPLNEEAKNKSVQFIRQQNYREQKYLKVSFYKVLTGTVSKAFHISVHGTFDHSFTGEMLSFRP